MPPVVDFSKVKPGDELLCWYPDFSRKPVKVTVTKVSRREHDGGYLFKLSSVVCSHCGNAIIREGVLLGEEWFDSKWVASSRKERRARERKT